MAVRLAAAGDHERAEMLVREIKDPWIHSAALVKVAGLMDEDSARPIVAEVLTTAGWRVAVPLAAKLIGPEVVEIGEILLKQTEN